MIATSTPEIIIRREEVSNKEKVLKVDHPKTKEIS